MPARGSEGGRASLDPFEVDEVPTKVPANVFLARKRTLKMQLVLVSHTKNPLASDPVLERIASVIEEQLALHYAAFWQSSGVPFVFAKPDKVRATDSPLVVFDDADQAGALGYHDVTPDGLPYGKIFLGPILENGGTILEGSTSLSATISHEALELVGDPYANAWHDMPDGRTEECRELCDRVENDSYVMDGVSVSNFLGPRAFRAGPGPYDWMRLLRDPWEIRPGGYVIRRTGGPAGKVDNVWGEKYPLWKLPGKKHPASRTSKRVGKRDE